jgi:uncharacterized damage-inducible protein DinB
MTYGAKELAESFRTVRKNTIVIAGEIGEDNYGFQAAPGVRTVSELLVHIALMPRLQEQVHKVERRTNLEGFDFPGFMHRLWAEEKLPRSKAQVLGLLQEEGERYAQWLDGLTADFLHEMVTFPPGMTPAAKSRMEMIVSAKEHEMHHRGQLMLVERMLGIVPHLTRSMQQRIAEMKR